ncbi:MAG: excinuclease ABC subunit UvrC [Polyangiaceae bacterium]|nr:excinuclease ABC subunit UvrC [Polyangiaceae bacterium]
MPGRLASCFRGTAPWYAIRVVPEALGSKLDTLPTRPGCYLFKDKEGIVIYVGKATSLRSRVRSYFQEGGTDTRAMLPHLLRAVTDVDTVVTATEKEATILEDSLVKQHKPRFNVKLRDDKSYLSLRLDPSQAYPRLELVRRPSPDGARYFGPHHSATSARRTLNFINKHFHLRTCSDAELSARKRPCLQYHIKRCPAPCIYEVDREHYTANVQSVLLFLGGKHDEVSEVVQARMREASNAMDFELAAVYRDQLRAVHSVREAQRVVAVTDIDQDVMGLHRDGDLCELALLFVRGGRVVDTTSFPMRKVEVPDEEVIGAFIAHFYGETGAAAHAIPDEVVVPSMPESPRGVEEWLSDRRGRVAKLVCPKRGPRVRLVKLATDNAQHAFQEKRRGSDDVMARLEDIQRRLRLAAPPHVIECCDISHLGGDDTAGGLVRMVDGEFDKSGYRAFHVRQVPEGDDYGAMLEVLSRRFRRARDAEQRRVLAGGAEPRDRMAVREPEQGQGDAPERDRWQLPDLLVVDGGRGQLNAALKAARDLGMHDLAIVGLAKERETAMGETMTDRIYLPGQKNGVPVRPHSALVLLARLRDESHRFANRVRERLGRSRRMRSELDAVAGIGPATRQKLLAHVGGAQAVRQASDEQLLAVPGVNRRHVAALREAFGCGDEHVPSSGHRAEHESERGGQQGGERERGARSRVDLEVGKD